MKLRFAPATDVTDTGAALSFTDVVAPLDSTDFHTSKDEGHLHHTELANLAAMARSIFHQVGATEIAQPELTTLVNFDFTNGEVPRGSLIAAAANASPYVVTLEQVGSDVVSTGSGKID